MRKRHAERTTGSGRPLRVLLTTDWWEPVVNGVVASVATLRRELIALGCDVRVLTLASGLRTRNEDGVYRIGSVSAGMVYDSARIGMPASKRVLREILRWHPDVIHSHCEFSSHMWARKIARALDVPIVHTYHTIYEDYTHYYSPSRTVGRKVVATFSRRVLDGTDAVVVPTEKVARLLAGYGVTRPQYVIPTGLDLDRFRPARTEAELRDAAELRAGLGIRPDQRVLLSVARLAKEKNLDEVIDLVAGAGREDSVLVLVGDGPYREELVAHAAARGVSDRVVFAGVVDPSEVQRWYRIGDLFVSASLSETQGLTFIEAMACGLPLLCRRDPSLARVVVDGRTGWQYDGAADFAAHLDQMLGDDLLRAAMSHEGVAHVHATFGSRAFGSSVLSVYRSAIERRSPLRVLALEPLAA
ncbi:glycosyltransferase family 4 protein [Brachybacterium squillarum]|uniref:glycosyltransferase family 4 protein n=1 Tax=Brachybacterium squillarum TaxID=661979 RepID=UPI0022235A02|nr:glycosyltransferase family 4 protein [Brachybacterium squillarum]MCW1804134.1 glycosyltransferase family 4 protein [Brachybacterium squillarum]